MQTVLANVFLIVIAMLFVFLCITWMIVRKVIRWISTKLSKRTDDEVETTRIPCEFDYDLTEKEFEQIVRNAAKRIKRIESLWIEDGIIFGEVCSQSGISTWKFYIDFNQDGRVNGNYSAWRENTDSEIPFILAERISNTIKTTIENNAEQIRHKRRLITCDECGCVSAIPLINKTIIATCPHCGKKTKIYAM